MFRVAFMSNEMDGFELHHVLAEVLSLNYGKELCESVLKFIYTTIDTYFTYHLALEP